MEWDNPFLTYENHATTEIRRGQTADINESSVVHNAVSGVSYADGSVSPNTSYYYWIRWRSTDGALGGYSPVVTAYVGITPHAFEQEIIDFLQRAGVFQLIFERDPLAVADAIDARIDELVEDIRGQHTSIVRSLEQLLNLSDDADDESSALRAQIQQLAEVAGTDSGNLATLRTEVRSNKDEQTALVSQTATAISLSNEQIAELDQRVATQSAIVRQVSQVLQEQGAAIARYSVEVESGRASIVQLAEAIDSTESQVGPRGAPGAAGVDGADGQPGADGADGQPGADGADGLSYEFIYASVPVGQSPSSPSNAWGFDSPVSPWVDGAPAAATGHEIWWAQRVVQGAPTAGAAVSANWSVPGRLALNGAPGAAGLDGEDGEDGGGFEFIYISVPVGQSPSAPSNTWGFDSPVSPWQDGSPGAQSGREIWWSRRAVVGTPASGTAVPAEWSVPVRFAVNGADGADGAAGADGQDGQPGTDGLSYEFIYILVEAGQSPSAPSNAWGFDSPVSPWVDGAPAAATGHEIWWSQRAVEGTPAVGAAVPAVWSAPVRLAVSGVDGAPGAAGLDGADGQPGTDGLSYEFIYISVEAGQSPSAPSNGWGFDEPVSPWQDGSPGAQSGREIWWSQRVVVGTPAVGAAVPAAWSAPVRLAISGVDGAAGPAGPPGATGPAGPQGLGLNASTLLSVLQGATGTLSGVARWLVRTSFGDAVSATLGLVATASESYFVIAADHMVVLPSTLPANFDPNDLSDWVPFYVDTASGRVFMRSVFIQDGTITTAQISEAHIEWANINNVTITSAHLTDVDILGVAEANVIQSLNYNEMQGFRFHRDGTAFLNSGVVIRNGARITGGAMIEGDAHINADAIVSGTVVADRIDSDVKNVQQLWPTGDLELVANRPKHILKLLPSDSSNTRGTHDDGRYPTTPAIFDVTDDINCFDQLEISVASVTQGVAGVIFANVSQIPVNSQANTARGYGTWETYQGLTGQNVTGFAMGDAGSPSSVFVRITKVSQTEIAIWNAGSQDRQGIVWRITGVRYPGSQRPPPGAPSSVVIDTPIGFSAAQGGHGEIVYTWTAPPGLAATAYAELRIVEVGVNNFATTSMIHTLLATAGSYTATGLSADASYIGILWYCVPPSGGSSFEPLLPEYSDTRSTAAISPTAAPPDPDPDPDPEPDPPPLVSGFSAASGNRQVTLSWTRPSSLPSTTRAIIRRGSTFAAGASTEVNAGTANSYTWTGLDVGSSSLFWAFYRDTAQSPAVDGSEVSIVGMTTIPAPSGLSAGAGNGQVTLTWNNPSGLPSGTMAQIWWGTGSSFPDGTPDRTVNYTLTSQSITGLTNGQNYTFWLRYLYPNGVTSGRLQASAEPVAPADPGNPPPIPAPVITGGSSFIVEGAITVTITAPPGLEAALAARGNPPVTTRFEFTVAGNGNIFRRFISSSSGDQTYVAGSELRLGDGFLNFIIVRYQVGDSFGTEPLEFSGQTSAAVSARISAPANLSLVAGVEQITVSWTRPDYLPPGTQTRIHVGTGSFGSSTLVLPHITDDSESRVITGLTGGQPYTVWVQYWHANGQYPDYSSPTSSANATPTAAPVIPTLPRPTLSLVANGIRTTWTRSGLLAGDRVIVTRRIFNIIDEVYDAGSVNTFYTSDALIAGAVYNITVRVNRNGQLGPESPAASQQTSLPNPLP